MRPVGSGRGHAVEDSAKAPDVATKIWENGRGVIFTDGSAQDSKIGAAVVKLNHPNRQRRTRQIGIGLSSQWTVYAAELVSIYKAIEITDREVAARTHERTNQGTMSTIFRDRLNELLVAPSLREGGEGCLYIPKLPGWECLGLPK